MLLTFLVSICFSAVSDYRFTYAAGTWSEITGGTVLGTAVVGGEDYTQYSLFAQMYYNIPIPFLFGFNGRLHSKVNVCTAGYLIFGGVQITTAPISMNYAADGTISILGYPLSGNIWEGNLGEVRYETLGAAPNRIFAVQWKNFRGDTRINENYNFQIRLSETTNIINMVFGTMTVNYTGTYFPELGLRGTANTDFINRVVTTNWATSDAGTANNNVVRLITTVYPSSGCTYTFSPDAPVSVPNTATAMNPLNATSGVFTSTVLDWSDGGGWTDGFRLYFGTDYPPTNLVNGTDLGLVTSYNPPGDLASNTTHYWKIVPYNSIGENDAGSIWSFTTAGTPLTETKTIGSGGNYTSFTQAINALNAVGVGSGGVIFDVFAGTYSENPPPITASGAIDEQIIFQAASGANPVLAPVGGTGTFGFKLEGADYITFDNIDVNCPNNLNYGFLLAGLSGNGACNNTIKNCAVAAPAWSSYYGIYSMGEADGVNNNNTILSNSIDSFNDGIYITGSSTAGSESYYLNVQGNILSSCNQGIYAEYVKNLVIQYNNISFFSGGGSVYRGIYTYGIYSTYNIHHNTLSGGYTIANFYGIHCQFGSGSIDSNNISNVYCAGNSTWYGLFSSTGVTSWTNNTIIDINNTSNGSFFGFTLAGVFDTWSNNTISNITITTGTLYAASIGTAGTHKFHNNNINGLSSVGVIHGFIAQGGLVNTIYNNKFSNLNCTSSNAVTVTGITIAGGTTNNIYNNMIYDLRNGNGSAAPQVRGIAVTGGTTNNIWYNTVFLDALGTTANFSAAALYVSGGTTIDLKNNIFVNKSTPGATGYAVAFWKTTAGVSNLAAASNKNVYYAGIPDASHLIGYFNSVPYQTLADYKTMAFSKDQGSYTEDVPIASPVLPYDMHINPAVPTRVEGNAMVIAEVIDDIDGNSRNALLPDIGADEGNFTPLDEIPGNVTLLTPPDNSTGLNPNSLTVSWSAASTGGTPVYYRVFVADSAAGILAGYYSDVTHPSTSLDLSTVDDLMLGFQNTWYWAVQAVNDIGGSDTGDPGFMVWHFSTLAQMQSATTLAFGSVWPGSIRQGNIAIQNVGVTELTFNVSGPAEFSFGTPFRYVIPASTSVNLPYTFTAPLTQGAYSNTVTLEETSPGSSTIQLDVTANVSSEVTVGTGTSNLFQPVYPYYGLTYAQTIYPAAWFSYPNGYRIERIQYYWNPALAPTNTSNFKVWMGHTTQSVYPSTVSSSSWLPVSQMTLVFDGVWDISAGSGWKELVLQVPFVYNRTQNLVIAVDENTPGYDASGNGAASYFRGTTTAERRGISAYDDNDDFDPENPAGIPQANFTSYASRTGYPNTRFILGAIPIPPLTLPFLEDWSSSLLSTNYWTAGSENWQISSTYGNPEPSVIFLSAPELTDYEYSLTSHEFDATGLTSVKLKFNLNLNYSDWVGNNYLACEVWNGESWNTLQTYAYYNVPELIFAVFDISSYAAGNVFKIRFRAYGSIGANLNYWMIDNIRLEEIPAQINTPQNLTFVRDGDNLVISWDAVSEADWYAFYIAYNPYGPFYYASWIDASVTTLIGEIDPGMDEMLFFRITAGAGNPPSRGANSRNPLKLVNQRLKRN